MLSCITYSLSRPSVELTLNTIHDSDTPENILLASSIGILAAGTVILITERYNVGGIDAGTIASVTGRYGKYNQTIDVGFIMDWTARPA